MSKRIKKDIFQDLTKRLFKAKPIRDVLRPKEYEHIGKIRLFHGEVLDHTDCRALVSFITADLSLGGPLNKAFLALAGEELGDYIAEHVIKPRPGEVFSVPPFKVPVENIILTTLPEWRGGIDDEDRAMLRCYRRAVMLAQDIGIKSIAFPALGFGRRNFPHIRFVRLAVRGILEGMDGRMDEVRIVCKERGIAEIYAKHLTRYGWKPAAG